MMTWSSFSNCNITDVTITLSIGIWTRCSWEIKTGSKRIFSQDQLTADDNATLMKYELDVLAQHRLRALISIEENEKRVARWYDKKVKTKEFANGDLLWKLILLNGTKGSKFGKWSPNWEGPYRINRSAPGNAYILETLEGVEFLRALNGKYLKIYYTSIWIDV